MQRVEDDSEVFLDSWVCQHSVSLVQYQELEVRKVLFELELVVLELVDESTWRCHYDVGDVGKLRRLLHHVDATRDD